MAENKLADMSTEFAVKILNLTDGIKGHYSLANQLERSGTSIGDSAFYGCSRLTSIKYRGTEAQWNAIYKDSGWNTYTGDYTSSTGNYTVTYNYTGE